jgi:lipopolysaccharide/colanic/teichoic acid biosynthesis glycosyltransferase
MPLHGPPPATGEGAALAPDPSRSDAPAAGDEERAAAIRRSRAKRLIDIVVATCLLVVLAPLFAAIAIMIMIDSGVPVLYGQKRVAVDRRRGARRDPRERRFTCWKFRTMVRDAHAMRDGLSARNAAPFPAFKVPDDPRVTRVGRFLRKSSLDELPQLWNVLRGEMSLVGPRPPLPDEVTHYDDFALRRLTVRPGITCLWQIEQRHQSLSTFAQWVEKDVEYIANWSIMNDFVLIGRTALAVVRMTGD